MPGAAALAPAAAWLTGDQKELQAEKVPCSSLAEE